MKCISINDISFSYDNQVVYEHFSASFPFGETSVIMSPSGTGKTTLLYLIAGLLAVQNGTIIYPMENPKFSMVFQDDRLLDYLSVEKNIKLVRSDVSSTEIKQCLVGLGIEQCEKKKVKHLSGGQRQRVAIARALLADYDIMLLDEPFTGIDEQTKEKVIDYLKEKCKDKTVLMVTHDRGEAEKMGHIIPIMNIM